LATSKPLNSAAPVAAKEPVVTRRAVWLLFAACVFPTHVWAIIDVLREVPAWILRMSISELIGSTAYVLGIYALPDAVLLFVGVMVLAFILPARFLRRHLAVRGGLLALITAVWFILFHSNPNWLEQRQIVPLVVWALSYLLAVGGAYFLLVRRPRVETAVHSFVQRLATLSALYLLLDFISIIIVIVRNI